MLEQDEKVVASLIMVLSVETSHDLEHFETKKQIMDSLIERFEGNRNVSEGSKKNLVPGS